MLSFLSAICSASDGWLADSHVALGQEAAHVKELVWLGDAEGASTADRGGLRPHALSYSAVSNLRNSTVHALHLTEVKPGLLSRGDGLAIVQRCLAKPVPHTRLQRRVVGRITLRRLLLVQSLALAWTELSAGVMEGLQIRAHAISPELSVDGQVRMPAQRRDALGLTSLVDQGHGSVGIVALGERRGRGPENAGQEPSELHLGL